MTMANFKDRDKNAHNIIQLTFGGSSHHFLYDPAHIQTFADLRTTTVDFTKIKWQMFHNTFGIPAKYQDAYEKTSPRLNACVYQHLLQDPYMSDLARAAIGNTARCIEKLVTGPDSSDQGGETWERYISRRSVGSNTDHGLNAAFEVDLFPLLTSFLGYMTLPALMGHEFITCSPDFLNDLECLDESFISMTLGVPRWLPHARIKRAYEARDRLHKSLSYLYLSLDRRAEGSKLGSALEDFGDISRLFVSFDAMWKRLGLSADERAAAGLGLPWAYVMTSSNR